MSKHVCHAARYTVYALVTLSGRGLWAGELTVVSVVPELNALSAPTNTSVVLRFDRPVDAKTVTDGSFRVFGRWSGHVPGTFSLSDGDQTVTFTPGREYSAGEQVRVTVSHDMLADDGSPLRSAGYSFQFWTMTQPATMQFLRVMTISTNAEPGEHSQPYGGIASDMNQDGWLDLTIVNEVTADLRVFLNLADGSGLFQPFLQPTAPLGLFASPSEPADFNHDGIVDICVANQSVDSVSIWLGAGDGTFASNQVILVGAQPRGIAVLDVNGDGYCDIVNTNFNSSNMSLLLNDGTGVFGAPIFWDPGGSRERALAAADMDNDGILDLVIGNQQVNTVMVARGNGDATFTTVSTQDAGGPVWMLVVGDVNGDGNQDVSTANSTANNGAILLGDGQGNLAAPQTYSTDPFPLATDLGDLDGDGDLDWITSSFNGDWLLFVNDGTGNFAVDNVFDATSAASCALLFDIDNDGDLDLALVDEVADELTIMKNCGVESPECQCEVADPPLADMIGDDVNTKNRFLSFTVGDPPGSPLGKVANDNASTSPPGRGERRAGGAQAIRVTFTDLPTPFDVWNGAELWVGPTSEVSENGSSIEPIDGFPNFNAATLRCVPHYTDFSALGIVHVFHEGIVPLGTYRIQVINETCGAGNEANFSDPLVLTTTTWGDTLENCATIPCTPPDGVVNIIDVTGILGRFISDPDSIVKARADLEPGCLDLVINIGDVLFALAGFQGLTYTFEPSALDPCDSKCRNPVGSTLQSAR